ncbi:MAG TPA: DUF3618 domain-containing protein [Vicinamibacterales bacterium]|jgi:ElaB/YqjD/DUF883 family membrane-anchored ribosome-binding protein|nr:DUF3618 domain-containing protein [Vicinamibacterales bacterium]
MDDRTTRMNDEATRRARDIRSEIEDTREEMAETIDAIQDKLRPSTIVAGATERVKAATTERVRAMADTTGETAQKVMDRTRDTAGGVVEMIRDNPIPAALIGIGAAWMWMAGQNHDGTRRESRQRADWRTRSRRRDYSFEAYNAGYDRDADDYDDYEDYNTEPMTDRAKEYARETSDSIARAGRRAQTQLQRMINDNPLLVGAGALMLGAAFGMAVPETERENELMGDARDSVVGRAQQLASDAANKIQEKASEVANTAGNVANTMSTQQSQPNQQSQSTQNQPNPPQR